MTIYIVTVQGRYIDAFVDEEAAQELKYNLYMSGNDGIHIEQKILTQGGVYEAL